MRTGIEQMKHQLLVIVVTAALCCTLFSTESIAQAESGRPAASPDKVAAAETPLWQPFRITPRGGSQHIDLAGQWEMGYRDAGVTNISELVNQAKWIPASVPSTVQMALTRAGELPHPYYNLNSEKYKWVDEKVWYYRRTFDVPASAKGQNVFLCFDGIDYYARVWLNSTPLGRHEGMFGGPVIDVSEGLKYGQANEVVVEVRAANYGNKAGYKPRASGTIIKPWVIAGGTGGEMFFPLGMWRGARIEIVPPTHLERPFLTTKKATNTEAQLALSLEVLAGTNSLKARLHPWDNRQLDNRSNFAEHRPPALLQTPYALQIELLDKQSSRVVLKQSVPIRLTEGRNWIEHDFTVSNPKLWYPNGLGDAALHRVRLTLSESGKSGEAGREVDRIEFDHGIRTIETRRSKGVRTADRWHDWQFVVNGQPLFIKGVNWMPADILLDLPAERYRWLLGMAKNAGIQMIRVWGGGIIETDELYEVCDELGIMVWQDFPIGNQDTPQWPQEIWEAQVLHTVFRLRNHPSLAVYCGGNEFNAYSLGNAATIGILERSLKLFDDTRFFLRTSPDGGSIHTYPDMDPTWYARLYNRVPFVAETGMHNVPEADAIREVVNSRELERPLSNMYTKEFVAEHPDLIHHFVEYSPSRVPRMLSRASHIDDMRQPMLENLAEATQVGAGEFYQILSDGMQANYPVTTGLMPWVYKRPWPVIAIMLVDGFGQPNAPYYFLKRTYEPTHVLVKLPHLLWAAGEQVPINLSVVHAPATVESGLTASVHILDRNFNSRWQQQQAIETAPGPSVVSLDLGAFTIPAEFTENFFFIVSELKRKDGKLVSRSVYTPRCLKRMEDATYRETYRATPQPTLTLTEGPWLKRQIADAPTTLELKVISFESKGEDRSRVQVQVRNTGAKPSYPTRLDITGAKRAFYSTDNFFWLAPNEERTIAAEVLWREPQKQSQAEVTASAWNAPAVRASLTPVSSGKNSR